jgi:hypothetical protein
MIDDHMACAFFLWLCSSGTTPGERKYLLFNDELFKSTIHVQYTELPWLTGTGNDTTTRSMDFVLLASRYDRRCCATTSSARP